MVSPTIVESVKQYLRKLSESGLPVSIGVVFGSYASGTANEYSDIDVVVVSPQFDTTIQRQWVNQLWRVAARTDSRIEPIPCGKVQWQHDTSGVIIEIRPHTRAARHCGLRIDADADGNRSLAELPSVCQGLAYLTVMVSWAANSMPVTKVPYSVSVA